MKKILLLILIALLTISLAGCGSNNENKGGNDNQNGTIDVLENPADSINKLEDLITNDVEKVISDLNVEYSSLKEKIRSYDDYVKNVEKVEKFYKKIITDTDDLNNRLRKYSVNYAQLIINSGDDFDDIYDNLDEIYDVIYDEALDEVYDEIYNGILDDMYDDFYDGVIDDAYDTIKYSDWSAVRSDEYEFWSDTRSDVYKSWSNTRSDIYEFWSDLRSDIYNDDIEDANEEINDFKEDLEPTKNNSNNNTENNIETNTESNTLEIDAEFKKAMDDYEKFIDEYIIFMKKYANSDGTDIQLLKDYNDYLKKYLEMIESFDKWKDKDLNTEESKYYVEVQARVSKKLLDASI